MNIADRLKKIREELNLTQADFSEKCGISKSFLGVVESGKQSISFDFLIKVCTTFNVSADWLVFNVGRMFKDDNKFLSEID